MTLRLGTRASALAQWQAQWVAAQLERCGVTVELVPITTAGDRRITPIATAETQGVFTKEIQTALLDRRIDLAVHSLKDLPTFEPPELRLAAVPERGPAGDVLVLKSPSLNVGPLQPLPWLRSGAIVGTGSMRRRTQLLHARPDLKIRDIRGNVETRLRKLDDGEFDAVILAEAGLRRLGLDRRIDQPLPLDLVLPAVGQGALAIEIRTDDSDTQGIVAKLDHLPTHAAVAAERAMLAALHGGCMAPVAALAQVQSNVLTLAGRVLSCDGARRLDAQASAPVHSSLEAEIDLSEELGRHVAEMLLDQGAAELIAAARDR